MMQHERKHETTIATIDLVRVILDVISTHSCHARTRQQVKYAVLYYGTYLTGRTMMFETCRGSGIGLAEEILVLHQMPPLTARTLQHHIVKKHQNIDMQPLSL